MLCVSFGGMQTISTWDARKKQRIERQTEKAKSAYLLFYERVSDHRSHRLHIDSAATPNIIHTASLHNSPTKFSSHHSGTGKVLLHFILPMYMCA